MDWCKQWKAPVLSVLSKRFLTNQIRGPELTVIQYSKGQSYTHTMMIRMLSCYVTLTLLQSLLDAHNLILPLVYQSQLFILSLSLTRSLSVCVCECCFGSRQHSLSDFQMNFHLFHGINVFLHNLYYAHIHISHNNVCLSSPEPKWQTTQMCLYVLVSFTETKGEWVTPKPSC